MKILSVAEAKAYIEEISRTGFPNGYYDESEEAIDAIVNEIRPDALDQFPHDGAENYEKYMYGIESETPTTKNPIRKSAVKRLKTG